MVSEPVKNAFESGANAVLILVLVEDGLGEYFRIPLIKCGKSLNPCFSGGWSRRISAAAYLTAIKAVLILVLVEDGLGGGEKPADWECEINVLILVLVEDGLGVATFGSVCQRDCYNDIFNFVNVWRPKICTFSGVITDANLRIFGECEHVFRGYFGVFLCRCLIKKVGT